MNNFIFGILFVCVILPLIEDIMTLIASLTEYVNAAIVAKTRKDFGELFEQQEKSEENNNFPIGFATDAVGFDTQEEPSEYEEEQDDE